jgi:acyl-CoA thioester hydrolase
MAFLREARQNYGMTRPTPGPRAGYGFFHAMPTRWHDNDVYGHVNNVVYYSYIDTAVSVYLTAQKLADVAAGTGMAFVVESGCRYYAPVAFPDHLTVGLRIGHLGTSSVRYEAGIFRGQSENAAAEGYLVHVFVDRETLRPMPIPPTTRQSLAVLLAH